MSGLGDISNKALRDLIGTRNNTRMLVNLQDGTATFDSVSEPDGIIVFSIKGAAIAAADVTNKALATLAALQNPVTGLDGYYSQPVSTTVYYVWCMNAAGTSYVVQGTYSGQVITRGGRNGVGDGGIPDIIAGYCPLAVFKVVNGTNAVWIPATTNWNATSVVAYAAPVAVLPAAVADLTLFVEGDS